MSIMYVFAYSYFLVLVMGCPLPSLLFFSSSSVYPASSHSTSFPKKIIFCGSSHVAFHQTLAGPALNLEMHGAVACHGFQRLLVIFFCFRVALVGVVVNFILGYLWWFLYFLWLWSAICHYDRLATLGFYFVFSIDISAFVFPLFFTFRLDVHDLDYSLNLV